MRVYFLDTNVFLQCKPLDQLPWPDVYDGPEILLLVSPIVQAEIDKNKQDGNERRASRARKASALFRDVILSESLKRTLRESAPVVELSFSPPNSTSGPVPAGLDLTRADDQLIWDCLIYKRENPSQEVHLLTHDTGPMLTAKRSGLAFTPIPEDWLLAPEPDLRDRRIKELERRLSLVERSAPEISIEVTKDGKAIEPPLLIHAVWYDALTEEEIESLTTEVFRRHPIETDLDQSRPRSDFGGGMLASALSASMSLGGTRVFQPPSEEAIKEYRDAAYPKWQKEVREFFRDLADSLNLRRHPPTVVVRVTNTGHAPADNTIVELRTCGDLMIVPPLEDDEKEDLFSAPRVPSPPMPPKGKWVDRLGLMPWHTDGPRMDMLDRLCYVRPPIDSLKDILTQQQRDRHVFVWRSEKPTTAVDTWTFECVEFRHQETGGCFSIDLYSPPNANATTGSLTCTVTASNLPEPEKMVLPISIERSEGNTLEKARTILSLGFSTGFGSRGSQNSDP